MMLKEKKLNLNNLIKKELPFSERDILNILRIADSALADENSEKIVYNLMRTLHEHISFEELEEIHKKVNIFLQNINNDYGSN